ncbi:Pentatricopeptide repeat-containing protein [Actinidia chinensis var. chinensis]|uniref:Pentatricopeptide repeat-containing protein n=1 Tax=Actinidia chinensis var. chinensis TaxID=1590841 RepID=A0A2R6QXC4_ACTCC|nr:Pentatricopeptide repeat-containing protein [Actinidia chinensis var. chinensis]
MAISRSAGTTKLVSQIAQLGIIRGQRSYDYHTLLQTQFPNHCAETAVGSVKVQCVNQAVILRSTGMAKLVSRITELGMARVQTQSYYRMVHARTNQKDARTVTSLEDQNEASSQIKGNYPRGVCRHQIGENVSRKDKISFLVGTLLDLQHSKEAIYGALDAWVAWEQTFPIGSLKGMLLTLEKEQHWHRVVQVIKWMLSKGQGNTMGTYGQLIRALDMDHRAEEAHELWVKKFSSDLRSVPWQLCHLMISVYYRNNMLERLIKLFKDLETYDRKPTDKNIVRKVADAYELLRLLDERERVFGKYKSLFSEAGCSKGCRNLYKKKKK